MPWHREGRFPDQVDTAAPELGTGLVDRGHVRAHVLVAAVVEALAEVVEHRPGVRDRAGEQCPVELRRDR